MKGLPPALAADLHLHPGDGESVRRLEILLETAARRASALYVLGDLFDFWVGRGMEAWEAWEGAVRLLRNSPVPLRFLAGNRDFLAGADQLDRMGLELLPEETLVEDPDGRKWLLLHGDQLCTRDRAYQRTRRLLRSLPVRELSRVLPLSWRLGAARALRKRSARSLSRRDPASLAPTLEAVRARLEGGADGILCGHVHRAGRFRLPQGERPVLFVLPPWVEAGEWVLLEEGGPRRMTAGGGEAAWPPMEVLA